MKINTSPNNSTTYQCCPSHAGHFRISAYLFNGSLFWSNNIFPNDLCHYMVFYIGEFPANIYTFITHVQILCISIIAIHQPVFSNIWYWIQTQHWKLICIHSNTITEFIPPNQHARKTLTTLVRFLHILQFRFTQVTQLPGIYFNKKELTWMFSSNKFFLLITSPRVLSWQVHLG